MSGAGQGKVKVKSRQHKHNLNRNYNLMGFDTIEINLVYTIVIKLYLFCQSDFKTYLSPIPGSIFINDLLSNTHLLFKYNVWNL